MPDTDAIDVLLATYNGRRYLAEQVASILTQAPYPCRILARDDGSTDGTPQLLDTLAAAHPGRLTVLRDGAPTGSPKRNFLRLMRASTARYVMFADQDDVWKPDKVRLTVDAMRALEGDRARRPVLVFTDLSIVDRDLRLRHASYWAHQRIDPRTIHSLPRLLRQNVVTGCTALLNRPLVELALAMPEAAFMHDWWVALLACTLGEAGFVRTPTVLYRQHDTNSVGVAEPVRRRGLPRFRAHEKRREEWERCRLQAEALLETHGDALPREARRVLSRFVRCERSRSRVVRVATLLRYGFWHGELRRNLGTLWYLWDLKAAKQSPL